MSGADRFRAMMLQTAFVEEINNNELSFENTLGQNI
jgi:hypothetical protein